MTFRRFLVSFQVLNPTRKTSLLIEIVQPEAELVISAGRYCSGVTKLILTGIADVVIFDANILLCHSPWAPLISLTIAKASWRQLAHISFGINLGCKQQQSSRIFHCWYPIAGGAGLASDLQTLEKLSDCCGGLQVRYLPPGNDGRQRNTSQKVRYGAWA